MSPVVGSVPRAGVSHWWPTPARPGDHFTGDQLARSASLHRPIRRIRSVTLVAQTALLVGAAWLLGSGGPFDGLDDAPLPARASAGALAVVLAVRLPQWWAVARLDALADVERIADGSGRSPVDRIVGVVVPVIVLTAAAAVGLGLATDRRRGWLLVLAAVVALVVGAVLVARAQVRGAAAVEGPVAWDGLVERAGVGGEVAFGLLPEPDRPARPNACAVGFGRSRRVLVDPALLAGPGAPPPALRDFVVAHELTHLARRHPEMQLALNALIAVVALGALPTLGPSGWPWSLVGLAPDDARSLPVAALVAGAGALAARLPAAWVLRALERLADSGAVELVGAPDPAGARALHLGAGGELDPSTLAALTAAHPSPVERLEYLARRRRHRGPQDDSSAARG